MRTLVFSTVVFAASALAGPLLRFMAWPPSNLGQGSSVRGFVYDLVLLLWPAQLLATIEVSVGAFVAVAFSIAANILLFAVAGMVAGISARQPLRLLTVYLVVCGMVLMVALWAAGFSLDYLNILALSVAFILYALPFWIVFRFSAAGNK
jgi:hypothetical protein